MYDRYVQVCTGMTRLRRECWPGFGGVLREKKKEMDE